MSHSGPIYRGLDAAALDAQYNLRAAFPDHPQHFARWARESETARRSLPCRIDLAYGPAPLQKLDFFPGGTPRPPLLVFLHGGYWQAMDKSDFGFLAPAFTRRGIAVAIVNYSLAPAARLTAMVEESGAALRFLAGAAAGLGFAAERMAVAGHSAGGQLAAMTLLGAAPPPLACAVSGVFDLEPIRLCYLNRVLRLDAAEAAALSPLRCIAERPSGPAPGRLLLSGGGRETEEFRRQQADFAALWEARFGAAPVIAEQPEADHFTIMDRMAAPGAPLFEALCAAIGSL
jgi:arylformamidase